MALRAYTEGFLYRENVMEMGKPPVVRAGKRDMTQRAAVILVAVLSVGVILAAALVCYPPPWRTIDTSAGTAFAGITEINLNTADLDTLCLLPGIGKQRAEAILVYREINGPFAALEDVMNVSGIGPATVEFWQGLAVVR